MPATPIRKPARAGSFYPGTAAGCNQELAACRTRKPHPPKELAAARAAGRTLLGGVIPHAGWAYSGPTALAVFDALAASSTPPESVLIFATAHRPDVDVPSLQVRGSWRTPAGDAAIDEEFALAMLEEARQAGCGLIESALAHEGDHAIEVQLPFLLAALPGARFVPVAMPLVSYGPEVGKAAARAAQSLGRRAVALASTDLTHYGPNHYGFAPQGVGPAAHRWSKDVNDRRFLDAVLALDAEGAYAAAAEDRSACGPAAAAAAIAFAKERGAAKGILLEHITSWERLGRAEGEPQDFVGYASVAFV